MVAADMFLQAFAADAEALDQGLIGMIAVVQPSVVQVRSGRHGAGSGIVWRADGLIVTNHHVVARHSEVAVLFHDGRELRGTVKASDPILDLALVEVAARDLPSAPIGASERLRVGEVVVAVGNPWGVRGVATLGIVSGVGEVAVPWRRSKAEYIRSDVALAPGNSGGPLVNARGEVVGVNAMIFGGDLSVAIPAHVAAQFIAVAQAGTPALGLEVQEVELRGSWSAGLLVTGLDEGGLAAQAGLFVGDVLLDVFDKPLLDAHTLKYALVSRSDAAPLRLRFLRANTVQTITI